MKTFIVNADLARLFFLLAFSFLCWRPLYAQKSADVYVDKKGVMRWGTSGEEVYGFGVNYTVPFAHAYRAAKKLGVDHEEAIDQDIYHFARLGFDAFRVHVWDTEISDSTGNLIENEHLRLFDHALWRMKERGIKLLLTPIAYWGNGFPDPDEKTPGFSAKYGKDNCLVLEPAIRAQERYLFQFLNHVNPYTGKAYKDDPDIVAFEVSNEPHHRGTPAEVTKFINRMVAAMRKTGCKKPVFYNVSHSIHLSAAYYDAKIQGGTFQWYPTGLGARHELRGNFLPNVDRYMIPFSGDADFRKSAKIVYEFDAADVGRSYPYPAMARSFREAGIQWATHFAYDPTYMAYANTEYNTHYMNLVYTPSKAIALKIASEVFHNIPMYASFGRYPANTTFGPFRVSYDPDLAEMVSTEKFFYTNSTDTKPANTEQLREIAGFGNSKVVKYGGQGAYFLDRVEKGVWRLEVLPDAIWIENPFGRNSLDQKVALINWRDWPIEINLPDLGTNYSITGLNDGNAVNRRASNAEFEVGPGTYLLVAEGVNANFKGDMRLKNIKLKEFAAPLTTLDETLVLHKPNHELNAGKPYTVQATVLTKQKPDSVVLRSGTGWRLGRMPMRHISGYEFEATIDAAQIREGYFHYSIEVWSNGTGTHFPDAAYSGDGGGSVRLREYRVPVLKDAKRIFLFNAHDDADQMSRQWRAGSGVIPTGEPGRSDLVIRVDDLFITDPENPAGERISDYSMRYHFGWKLAGRKEDLKAAKRLVVKARSMNGKACPVQVALVTRHGASFGKLITLDNLKTDHKVDLDSFTPVRMVILPRPYPTFLPYYFESKEGTFDLNEIETIQISIGPGMSNQEQQDSHHLAIESVWLEWD